MLLLSCMFLFGFFDNCAELRTPREVIKFIGEEPTKVWPFVEKHSNYINSICLNYDDVLVAMKFAEEKIEVKEGFIAEDFLASILDEPLSETCFTIQCDIQNPAMHKSSFLDKLSRTHGFTVKEILEYFCAETEGVRIETDYWITWSDKCFRYTMDEQSLGDGFEGKTPKSIINLTKDNKFITLKICTVF
ncbi:MAG: hypothetical protein H6510_04485 [Acidobacteria bacterium]|nr:hypothetical protein [Acidobacteriota bacterium]